MERILDISELPLQLRLRNGCLVLLDEGKARTDPIPLPEIGAVVVSNPQATLSRALLSGLSEAGVGLVVCDDKRLPVGMMLPLRSHSLQSERMQAQLTLGRPRRKRLHQQLVQAKLNAQGLVLERLRGRDFGLGLLRKRVLSGDAGNIEARAARIYWRRLFTSPFRRDPDAEGINGLLNYGYAVLRAMVGRSLAGAGLHPGIGLFHHSRYNPFCLADDMIEPYRPLVDLAVASHVTQQAGHQLDGRWKATLLRPLLDRYRWRGEERTLFDWMAIQAHSLAAVCLGKQVRLILPCCLEGERG